MQKVILLCLLLLCPTCARAQRPELKTGESAVVCRLMEMDAEAAQNPDLFWNGFTPLYKPLAVYFRYAGQTALLTAAKPYEGFLPARIRCPGPQTKRFFLKNGQFGNIIVDSAKETFTATDATLAQYPQPGARADAQDIAMLVREAFSQYFDQRFGGTCSGAAGQENNPAFVSEQILLARALMDTQNARAYLKAFAELRVKRHASEDVEFLITEKEYERNAGAAECVRLKAERFELSEAFRWDYPARLEIAARLLADISGTPNTEAGYRDSGLAQMALMDMLGIPYKQRVEKGVPPFAAIKEYFFSKKPVGQTAVLPARGLEKNPASPAKAAPPNAPKPSEQLFQRFTKSAGRRIFIRSPYLAHIRPAAARAQTKNAQGDELFYGVSQAETAAGKAVSLTIKNCSFIRRGNGELEILTDEDDPVTITADGKPVIGTGYDLAFKKLEMGSQSVYLKSAIPGRLIIEEGRATVEIRQIQPPQKPVSKD